MMMMMATAYDFELPIKSEEHLQDFINLAFGVKLPDVQVCPNHSTPWQAFCDAYFARYPVIVIKASRGFGGKSFMLALLSLVEALTLKADVSLLGGSGAQSKIILEHMAKFWNYKNAPRNLLVSDIQQEMRFAWGNKVRALMASQTSVRGPHNPRLRCDEIDEMDIRILDAALGQPMSTDAVPAQTILSSTHQNADGTMTEILRRAAVNGYKVHEWCWREASAQPNGWLTQEEIERKRSEVSATMWAVEYDLQEPSPESRAIMPEKVEMMFRPELGVYEGKAREYIEIEAPIPGAAYVTGADWARKQDWTIIITMRTDIRPMKIVTYERMGRLPWPVMIERLDYVNERYKVQTSAHDGTGLGDVVNDYLKTQSVPVIMSGRTRQDMLSECISAIENEVIISPDISYFKNELKYASVDDVYGSGHLPDSLSALALAYRNVGYSHMGGIYL